MEEDCPEVCQRLHRCPNTQREQVEILQGDILRVRESERVLKSTTPEFECRWFDVIRSDDFDEPYGTLPSIDVDEPYRALRNPTEPRF